MYCADAKHLIIGLSCHVEKVYPGRLERQTLGRMSILYTERFDGSSANICPEKHFNQNAFIVYL